MPPAFTAMFVPVMLGTTEAGAVVQVCGGLLPAAVQLSLTLRLYPFRAEMVPLNFAVSPAKIVNGLLLIFV